MGGYGSQKLSLGGGCLLLRGTKGIKLQTSPQDDILIIKASFPHLPFGLFDFNSEGTSTSEPRMVSRNGPDRVEWK